jgi:predicted nucleic acid-binding protein
MVIVDTTVWIDYLGGVTNPHTAWLERELSRQPLGLTDLILCELLQGIRQEKAFNQVRQEMSRFTVFDSGGEAIAVAAAKNHRFLRSRGLTVRKTIDCVIATFCLRSQHALLHRDRDFDPFEQHLGLNVLHPSTALQ